MGPQSRPVEFNSSESAQRPDSSDPSRDGAGREPPRSGGRPFHGESATTGPPAVIGLGVTGGGAARRSFSLSLVGGGEAVGFPAPCYSPRVSEACRRTEESHAAASASADSASHPPQ